MLESHSKKSSCMPVAFRPGSYTLPDPNRILAYQVGTVPHRSEATRQIAVPCNHNSNYTRTPFLEQNAPARPALQQERLLGPDSYSERYSLLKPISPVLLPTPGASRRGTHPRPLCLRRQTPSCPPSFPRAPPASGDPGPIEKEFELV